MAARNPNEARVYLRRSTGKQESSMYAQLEWAVAEAPRHGVRLDASRADLDHMLAHRLTHYKHVYLDDGITGADLTRPGFTAFRRDAMRDRSVSHLFIHMSDRFARPELATEATKMEQDLLYGGLTIVFSNRVSEPRRRGENYFGQDMQIMFSYMESGEYLNKLAVRVLQTQANLARNGRWTGGQPPYGFARYRVMNDGTEVELPRGTSIRQPGSHTVIRPKDGDKIRTWAMALHWCADKGWGCKRIASELNELGIPSPDAGRTRTEGGRRHKVSGLWTPSTVRALLRNHAIIGFQRYGVQAEGHHRRLGPDGPRLLEDADQREGKPKVVENPAELVIRSPLPAFEPVVKAGVFDAAQAVLDRRGKSQRGIAKTRDAGRYPLSTRVYDMACGHPMWARTSGERRLYTCGKYINSSGKQCEHNQVDAEATLAFVLQTLRQKVVLAGGRAALRGKLEAIARASQEDRGGDASKAEFRAAEGRLRELEREEKLLADNLGRAEGEAEFAALRPRFHAKRREVERARRHIEELKRRGEVGHAKGSEIDEEVDKALALLEDIERIATQPEARAEVRPMFTRLNLNLFLNFAEGRKGKRAVRMLTGGVMTIGDAPLPVQPYGDNCDGGGTNGQGEIVPLSAMGGQSETPALASAGVSLCKVHRGDRT